MQVRAVVGSTSADPLEGLRPTPASQPRGETGARPFWRDALAPYEQPRVGRSLLDVATSALPYLAICVGMYLALSVSVVLSLALALPAAGFLIRTFVIFHDCTHGSLLPSKRANRIVGVVSACSCSLRLVAGAMTTRCTTPALATSSAAASETSRP